MAIIVKYSLLGAGRGVRCDVVGRVMGDVPPLEPGEDPALPWRSAIEIAAEEDTACSRE
jgi:hypothetical protein